MKLKLFNYSIHVIPIMALKIRLFQLKSKNLKGKWYGRAISNREVHTEEMAKNICYRTTLTEADVHAAARALITEMTNWLWQECPNC